MNTEAMNKWLRNHRRDRQRRSWKTDLKFSRVGDSGIQLGLSHSSNGLKAVTTIHSSGSTKNSPNSTRSRYRSA